MLFTIYLPTQSKNLNFIFDRRSICFPLIKCFYKIASCTYYSFMGVIYPFLCYNKSLRHNFRISPARFIMFPNCHGAVIAPHVSRYSREHSIDTEPNCYRIQSNYRFFLQRVPFPVVTGWIKEQKVIFWLRYILFAYHQPIVYQFKVKYRLPGLKQ